jgi:hypothetical protein
MGGKIINHIPVLFLDVHGIKKTKNPDEVEPHPIHQSRIRK